MNCSSHCYLSFMHVLTVWRILLCVEMEGMVILVLRWSWDVRGDRWAMMGLFDEVWLGKWIDCANGFVNVWRVKISHVCSIGACVRMWLWMGENHAISGCSHFPFQGLYTIMELTIGWRSDDARVKRSIIAWQHNSSSMLMMGWLMVEWSLQWDKLCYRLMMR